MELHLAAATLKDCQLAYSEACESLIAWCCSSASELTVGGCFEAASRQRCCVIDAPFQLHVWWQPQLLLPLHAHALNGVVRLPVASQGVVGAALPYERLFEAALRVWHLLYAFKDHVQPAPSKD